MDSTPTLPDEVEVARSSFDVGYDDACCGLPPRYPFDAEYLAGHELGESLLEGDPAAA